MGTETLVEYWNDVMEELGKYYVIEHIKPIYGKEYMKFKLIKKSFSNQEPTVVTIKSNKRIVFSVDAKAYMSILEPILQSIGVKQKEYSKTSNYKGKIRIVCGHKQIKGFLAQLPTLSQYI